MLIAGDQDKPERLVHSIPNTARVLGDVSPNHVRNLISGGLLDRVRIGRRVMVTTASIKRLLEAQQDERET